MFDKITVLIWLEICMLITLSWSLFIIMSICETVCKILSKQLMTNITYTF